MPEQADAIERESKRRHAMKMRVVGEEEVTEMTNLSRVTRWRLERNGQFPKRLRLTGGRVGWIESEIYEWIKSRPRGAA